MSALGRMAVCAALVTTGAGTQAETLADQLGTLAPDFELGWQGSLADIRTRADAISLAEAFGTFEGQDDDGYFDTDYIEYILEGGLPLDSQPRLVSY